MRPTCNAFLFIAGILFLHAPARATEIGPKDIKPVTGGQAELAGPKADLLDQPVLEPAAGAAAIPSLEAPAAVPQAGVPALQSSSPAAPEAASPESAPALTPVPEAAAQPQAGSEAMAAEAGGQFDGAAPDSGGRLVAPGVPQTAELAIVPSARPGLAARAAGWAWDKLSGALGVSRPAPTSMALAVPKGPTALARVSAWVKESASAAFERWLRFYDEQTRRSSERYARRRIESMEKDIPKGKKWALIRILKVEEIWEDDWITTEYTHPADNFQHPLALRLAGVRKAAQLLRENPKKYAYLEPFLEALSESKLVPQELRYEAQMALHGHPPYR